MFLLVFWRGKGDILMPFFVFWREGKGSFWQYSLYDQLPMRACLKRRRWMTGSIKLCYTSVVNLQISRWCWSWRQKWWRGWKVTLVSDNYWKVPTFIFNCTFPFQNLKQIFPKLAICSKSQHGGVNLWQRKWVNPIYKLCAQYTVQGNAEGKSPAQQSRI